MKAARATHSRHVPHTRFWLRVLRSYPRGFGKALAELVAKHLEPVSRTSDFGCAAGELPNLYTWLQFSQGPIDLWEDAHLTDVVQYLWSNKHCRREWLRMPSADTS